MGVDDTNMIDPASVAPAHSTVPLAIGARRWRSALQTFHATLVLLAEAQLAESPLWDRRSGELLWVDLPAGQLHGCDLRTGQRWSVGAGQEVTFVVPRASGGYVVGLRDGVGVCESRGRYVSLLAPLTRSRADLRMNDGACDPKGRLWAGTASLLGEHGRGALFCVAPDLNWATVLTGITTSNGIGWSPDGSKMYYVDSAHAQIDVIERGHRTTLVTIPSERGVPDGLAVDVQGFIWVALWGGGAVERYSPGGVLDSRVEVPVSLVTNCAFGGTEGSTLYVTTAAHPGEQNGGSIFAAAVGVGGLPPVAFAG